jgi:cold shock CspA family protein
MHEEDETERPGRQKQVSFKPMWADCDTRPLEIPCHHAKLTLIWAPAPKSPKQTIFGRRAVNANRSVPERRWPTAFGGVPRTRIRLSLIATERKHMESAPHIDFHGMEASAEFRDKITHHLSRLEERFGRITACHVTVRAPSSHRHTGGPYEIKIHLSLPDEREVDVDRTPHQDERFQDFDFALNDAFNRAGRQLQDQVRRMRGKVKHHAEAPAGVIRKLMPEDGYGFLESADGREIYFHRNSVAEPGFDGLKVGERVAFTEEEGEKGPQASRVTPLAESAPR